MHTQMVWAKKWKLLTPQSIKDGTFKINGQKEEGHDWKLVARQFVEDRNSFLARDKTGRVIEGVKLNNEWYEIDEDKTAELMKVREEKIKEQAEKRQKERIGQSDLVDGIKILANAVADKSNDTDDESEKELLEAREKWSELHDGKTPHPRKKLANLNKEIIAKMEEIKGK